MSQARRVDPEIKFNKRKTNLDGYIEKIEYDDVATGASDTISIELYNANMKWMHDWLPKKGDRITATLIFKNWKKAGVHKKMVCGDFLLDEMKMSGGPLIAELGGISIPSHLSIKLTNRTKTWNDIYTNQIAYEISKKYGLGFHYDGPNFKIGTLEQTDQSDSAFLYGLCKKYGLGMKIYNNKIVIYGKSQYEKKKAAATISRSDFISDGWEYVDTLEGTYTGARTSYKSGDDDKEISIYVGMVPEGAKGSRTLKVSEQSENEADARAKAIAQVNLENEKATVLSGDIFARPDIVAGICVNVKDLGKANGKYFVDEVKTMVSSSGTTQNITMHKCKKQL